MIPDKHQKLLKSGRDWNNLFRKASDASMPLFLKFSAEIREIIQTKRKKRKHVQKLEVKTWFLVKAFGIFKSFGVKWLRTLLSP
jgi:hypothetical protein